jgi:hypothetical protein
MVQAIAFDLGAMLGRERTIHGITRFLTESWQQAKDLRTRRWDEMVQVRRELQRQ